MRKRTRITALTMAATLLASGTAFAYDLWPAEYSIEPGKGEVIVSNNISSPAVPYSGTDHVEVTEVAGKDTVIIKDTIYETEINDGRRATIAVNADVNVKVGDGQPRTGHLSLLSSALARSRAVPQQSGKV